MEALKVFCIHLGSGLLVLREGSKATRKLEAEAQTEAESKAKEEADDEASR